MIPLWSSITDVNMADTFFNMNAGRLYYLLYYSHQYPKYHNTAKLFSTAIAFFLKRRFKLKMPLLPELFLFFFGHILQLF